MLADYTWYAVMTNAREEQLAADSVEQLGYQPLFLHLSASREDKQRSWLVKRPYLPRYIFVGLGPEKFSGGAPILMPIATARGVACVVRAPGGDPSPIPLRAMELITLKAELPGGLVHTKKPLLRFAGAPGFKVKLSASNAFQGLIAAITHIDPRGEISVEIEPLFGRSVPTRIGLEDIDQLLDPSGTPVDKLVEPRRTETSAN